MNQRSQFKAMDSYFQSLLSETVVEPLAPQPELAQPLSTPAPFAEPVIEQQTRLADLWLKVEPLTESQRSAQSVEQVKVQARRPQPPRLRCGKTLSRAKSFRRYFLWSLA